MCLCVTQVSAEEAEKMAQAIKQEDGSKRTIEKLLRRRKLKKTYEYEVLWKGHLETTWLSYERLEEMGFQKMMAEVNAKEAAQAGLALKPLTQANIEKHLQDLGLDPEFGTHSQMRGLSGKDGDVSMFWGALAGLWACHLLKTCGQACVLLSCSGKECICDCTNADLSRHG